MLLPWFCTSYCNRWWSPSRYLLIKVLGRWIPNTSHSRSTGFDVWWWMAIWIWKISPVADSSGVASLFRRPLHGVIAQVLSVATPWWCFIQDEPSAMITNTVYRGRSKTNTGSTNCGDIRHSSPGWISSTHHDTIARRIPPGCFDQVPGLPLNHGPENSLRRRLDLSAKPGGS